MDRFSPQESFRFVKLKVFQVLGRRLNEVETAIILGSLQGKTYKEIAQETGYSAAYLHHDAGPDVWEMLRDVLGRHHANIQVQLQNKRRLPEVIQTLMQLEAETIAPAAAPAKIVQGQLPDTTPFFGRSAELDRLAELIEDHRCVSVLGGAGIGKSALVAKLIQEELALGFDRYIWQPLRHSPSVDALVHNLNTRFDPESQATDRFDDRMQRLLYHLQTTRTLIVFDSAEYMHPLSEKTGHGGTEAQRAEQFVQLLRMVATEDHQSCVVLTSREPIRELLKLQQAGHSCKSLRIRGLDTQACVDLLVDRGLAPGEDLLAIILRYRGEPLDLKLTASYIQTYCGGSVSRFLAYNTTLMSDVRQENLDRLFAPNGRLSSLERAILIYISIETERTGAALRLEAIVSYLSRVMHLSQSMTNLLKALEFLQDCSLLERSTDADTGETFYEVQPTIQKYIRVDPSGYIQQSRAALPSPV